TTLKKMQRLDGWNVLAKRTERFAKTVNEGLQKKGLPLTVSHTASLFWIHGTSSEPIRTVEQIPANQSLHFKNIFLKSLDKGVYLAPNAYEVGFVSLAHTDDLLDQAAALILESVD
ncbi:MAG: aspartate aminotransferase family protein, partial [Bdellovibrio sp.]|nr:aspartate aminotransferase family protein [Bdellovibrio sp.]